VRALICPDKFRGTLSARSAGEALASGWRRIRPGDDLDVLPMADGGEGTMEALVDALDGRTVQVRVTGPLGDPVEAAFGLVSRPDGLTGVVEMAAASGLALVSEGRRDPGKATTAGTGELIRAALDAGAHRLIVTLGGSATNDGGAGMASALGTRFLDERGRRLPPGGAALLRLTRIDAARLDPRVAGASIVAACDVDNPLTGPSGASVVFGPQKGAGPDHVLLLDRALGHLAAVVHRDLGVAATDEPGAGAAGGLGFGLLVFCGAILRPGARLVMDALEFESRLASADLVVTGEGMFDATSLRGKTVGGVLELAAIASTPAVVVCGDTDGTPAGVPLVSLVERLGRERALEDTRRSLGRLGEELAGRLPELLAGARG
jgi:glycerate 2-kinase